MNANEAMVILARAAERDAADSADTEYSDKVLEAIAFAEYVQYLPEDWRTYA